MTEVPSPTLAELVKQAQTQVEVNGTYTHYKNAAHTYKVIAIAIQEADENICVVYQAEYGDKLIFTRPLTSWLDVLNVDGKPVARFSKQA